MHYQGPPSELWWQEISCKHVRKAQELHWMFVPELTVCSGQILVFDSGVHFFGQILQCKYPQHGLFLSVWRKVSQFRGLVWWWQLEMALDHFFSCLQCISFWSGATRGTLPELRLLDLHEMWQKPQLNLVTESWHDWYARIEPRITSRRPTSSKGGSDSSLLASSSPPSSSLSTVEKHFFTQWSFNSS